MTKRVSESWLLELGEIKDVNAMIYADVDNFRPKLVSVIVNFKTEGGAMMTMDVYKNNLLTEDCKSNMCAYLSKLHCVADAIEWDISDGPGVA